MRHNQDNPAPRVASLFSAGARSDYTPGAPMTLVSRSSATDPAITRRATAMLTPPLGGPHRGGIGILGATATASAGHPTRPASAYRLDHDKLPPPVRQQNPASKVVRDRHDVLGLPMTDGEFSSATPPKPMLARLTRRLTRVWWRPRGNG